MVSVGNEAKSMRYLKYFALLGVFLLRRATRKRKCPLASGLVPCMERSVLLQSVITGITPITRMPAHLTATTGLITS